MAESISSPWIDFPAGYQGKNRSPFPKAHRHKQKNHQIFPSMSSVFTPPHIYHDVAIKQSRTCPVVALKRGRKIPTSADTRYTESERTSPYRASATPRQATELFVTSPIPLSASQDLESR
jgi:hypothetical protein